MLEMFLIPFIVVMLLLLYLLSTVNILKEYERGVVFRLGRFSRRPPDRVWYLFFWPVDQMVRVSLRTITLEVPPQDIITRDNVTVKVNAIVYFRVYPRLGHR